MSEYCRTNRIRIPRRFLACAIVLAGAVHPAAAAVLTVGQSGANYTSFAAAVNAVSQANTTIRFIDSALYNETAQLSLTVAKYAGLTIESAPGQRATVNFTGSGSYGFLYGNANMTLRNINLVNGGRTALFLADGNGTNATVTGVNFKSTVAVSTTYLLGAGGPNMSISYCTFRGTGNTSADGRGISAANTGITVDHCSFDYLGYAPIYTPVSSGITVTNCAFGAWYNANTYRTAIHVAGGTLFEDYNASWGGGQELTYGPNAVITRGGHSFKTGLYAGTFSGDTGMGDWTIGFDLYRTAADGTNIGAWQGQLPDRVNVQDFGAAGDGTTDDTRAIQAALNVGVPVYFPRTLAFYKISGGLTYSGHQILSDGATIKATGTDYNLLTVSGVTGLYIGDLTLEYPTEQAMRSASAPLTLDSCSDFLVERVIGRKGGAIYVANSDNGTIRECQMLTAAYNAFEAQSSTGITFADCYAENAVSAYTSEDSTEISIRNCAAEDSCEGLRIEDSANVLAEGNLFRYCSSGAEAYGPQSGSSIFTTDLIFRGNTFYRCYKKFTFIDDPYVNQVGEFVLSSKMYVGNVLFDNNIVIGRDESTLLTDLSTNVVFNASLPLDARYVATDTSGTSYHTMVPYVRYVYLAKNDGQMPVDWLFYVNFPSGVNLSAEKILTMDFYGGNDAVRQGTMAVTLYSGQNRTGFLCRIPMYNPYDYICLPCVMHIPDGVDVSSVKCIEVDYTDAEHGTAAVAISEIRKGLRAKVGYLHSYYHSALANGVQNAVLDSNVFVNIWFPYVDRKRAVAPPMTIIEGAGKMGTTTRRPLTPRTGWRYYDTSLGGPIYWDGTDWVDINTYWPSNKVSAANHFDGGNCVELGNDDRVNLNGYTIEGRVKPTTSGVADRNIIQRYSLAAPNGYLMRLSSDNELCGYQSVGGNFSAVLVHAPFPHDNVSHQAALTFSYNGVTSTLKLYIDGVLVDTASAAGAPDYPAQSAVVKCGDGFAGAINDINFYTRTLSGVDIRKCYERNAPSVNGTVVLAGYVGDPSVPVAVRVEFRQDGNVRRAEQRILGADGRFAVIRVAPGTYDVAVKAFTTLTAVVDNVTVINGADTNLGTIILKGADSNGDNQVTFEDFSLLQNNFGQRGATGTNSLSAAAAITEGCGPLGFLLLAGLGLALGSLRWWTDM